MLWNDLVSTIISGSEHLERSYRKNLHKKSHFRNSRVWPRAYRDFTTLAALDSAEARKCPHVLPQPSLQFTDIMLVGHICDKR
jgi:hypothetical protein